MWREEWYRQQQGDAPSGGSRTRSYVLVDQSGAPGFLSQLRRHPSLQWLSLFDGSTEASAPEVAPILVDLGEAAEGHAARALLAWLEQTCSLSTSVILLNSSLPLAPLAAALAYRLDAVLPDDMPVLLRYFDTRIFAALLEVLTAEQKEQYLAIASSWWWIDRAGELRHVAGASVIADPLAGPIVFDVKQEAALIAASEPDVVVQQMQTFAPDLCRDHTRHKLHSLAAECLPLARAYRIENIVGQALFCLTALTYGLGFHREPAWSAGLARVADGQLAYETLLKELAV